VSQVQRIKIPRMPDRSVYECFKKLGIEHNVTEMNVAGAAFSAIGAVDLVENTNDDFTALLEHNSTLIETCNLRISGLTVSYVRGGQYNPEDKSPIYDEIILNWNPQQGNLENKVRLEVIALINSELKAFEPGRFVSSGLSEEQNQLLSIHESTLERLERLNEDLIKQSSNFRENLEKQFEEKFNKAEENYEFQKNKLEESITKKSDDLEATKNKLEEKLKSIDDRDNTHVRREIRDKMLNDVKSRISEFGVSPKTEKKRNPVFIGIIFMVIIFLGLISLTGYELTTVEKQYYSTLETIRNISNWDEEKLKNIGLSSEIVAKVSVPDSDRTNIYWLWAKLSLLSIGLLGTILFYIRWQNRWAEQHSTSEFQLQQFYIDVNRANWVIESCLEWRKETKSAIPSELLGSITHNLFVSDNTELEKIIHPSDELASALMGSASKLKLKVGENELEFDKPGKISNKKQST